GTCPHHVATVRCRERIFRLSDRDSTLTLAQRTIHPGGGMPRFCGGFATGPELQAGFGAYEWREASTLPSPARRSMPRREPRRQTTRVRRGRRGNGLLSPPRNE